MERDRKLRALSRADTARIVKGLSHHVEHDNPYAFQNDVYAAVGNAILQGETKSLVVIPTGSGKSHMEAEIAAGIAREGGKVMVVTSRRSLVLDLHNRVLDRDLEEIGLLGEQSGSISAKQMNFDKPVTIIAYPSYAKAVIEERIDPCEFDLLLLDEAHNATTRRQLECQDRFIEEEVPIVAFTATRDMSFGSIELYGFKTIYDELSILEASLLGILSPIVIRHVNVSKSVVDLSNTRQRADEDFAQSELGRLLNASEINQSVLALWQNLCRNEPTLVFCSTKHHAHSIARTINSSFPGAAVAVSGDTPINEQDEISSRLADKSDELMVVVNAEVWGEGKDIPEVKNVIMVNITNSPRSLIQKVGRAFRQHEGKTAVVYEYHYQGISSLSMVNILEGNASTYAAVRGEHEAQDPSSGQIDLSDIFPPGFEIVTDIQTMLETSAYNSSGQKDIQKISDAEVALNPYALSTPFTFSSRNEEAVAFARQLIEDIVQSGLGTYESRVGGNGQVQQVFTNKDEYVRQMLLHGYELYGANVDQDTFDDNCIYASRDDFRKIFVGSSREIQQAVQEIVSHLQANDPDILFTTRRSGSLVYVIRDKTVPIKMMEDMGFVLRENQEIVPIQDGETALGSDAVKKLFSGRPQYSFRAAQEIFAEYENDENAPIVKRLNRGHVVRATTDLEWFAAKMSQKGFNLR